MDRTISQIIGSMGVWRCADRAHGHAAHEKRENETGTAVFVSNFDLCTAFRPNTARIALERGGNRRKTEDNRRNGVHKSKFETKMAPRVSFWRFLRARPWAQPVGAARAALGRRPWAPGPRSAMRPPAAARPAPRRQGAGVPPPIPLFPLPPFTEPHNGSPGPRSAMRHVPRATRPTPRAAHATLRYRSPRLAAAPCFLLLFLLLFARKTSTGRAASCVRCVLRALRCACAALRGLRHDKG